MFDIEKTLEYLLRGTTGNDREALREKLEEVASEGRYLRIKFGMDPSAPDLHLGHAVALRKIKQLQDLGHTAVIIIGDFTGAIGDPSGKSKTRNQLSREEVMKNSQTYFEQIFKIIDKDRTELHFNSEWYSKMSFQDVIELASKVTVARMLERDDFNNRYTNNKPIGIHEFFYPLMQAYDSVMTKADIEMGGTDQTFNVMMGRNIQKVYDEDQQVPLFVPLLVGIDGKEKMSKSLGNYVGITEDARTSFAKLMKLDDSAIISYFELATDVDSKTIDRIRVGIESGKLNPRDVKIKLAMNILGLYHSKDEVEDAYNNFRVVYQNADIKKAKELPLLYYDKESLDKEGKTSLIECIHENEVFSSGSKSQVRRLITQGGVRINNLVVTDLSFIPVDGAVVRVGKNRLFILRDRELAKEESTGDKELVKSR